MKLDIGYLFKKIDIEINNDKLEIFEFVDYVCGISFENRLGDLRFNITSGNYAGKYASYNSNKIDENTEYFFWLDKLDNAIHKNNNEVNFNKIREIHIKNINKYYYINQYTNDLMAIKDENIINHIEEYKKINKSDFNEKEFKENTDISSMYQSIKKTVISQDEQIMRILTALFKNQKVINSNLDADLITKLKENILICGSTGTGKTEILKRISKLYNIPIVIEDATSLSETGYVGRKITDMLEDLCLAANGNIELAEKGILVIDEFDKLAENKSGNTSHVSKEGVQRSLLKLLDGTLFYFENKKFDTSKLTIVALGAFTGITNDENFELITSDDFTKYGIMQELIGRFSKVIYMNQLKKEDIIKILKESDFSPLNTYKNLFELLEVDFEFNDDFIEYIAELAIHKKSGARSLKTVFDDCISSALFRIFAGEYSSISLIKPDDNNDKPYILTKKNK